MIYIFIDELKLEESSEEMKDFENETDSDEEANEPQMKKKKRKIPLFTINITDSYVSYENMIFLQNFIISL